MPLTFKNCKGVGLGMRRRNVAEVPTSGGRVSRAANAKGGFRITDDLDLVPEISQANRVQEHGGRLAGDTRHGGGHGGAVCEPGRQYRAGPGQVALGEKKHREKNKHVDERQTLRRQEQFITEGPKMGDSPGDKENNTPNNAGGNNRLFEHHGRLQEGAVGKPAAYTEWTAVHAAGGFPALEKQGELRAPCHRRCVDGRHNDRTLHTGEAVGVVKKGESWALHAKRRN
eukprot:gene436-14_t